jgi:hypothetical protein
MKDNINMKTLLLVVNLLLCVNLFSEDHSDLKLLEPMYEAKTTEGTNIDDLVDFVETKIKFHYEKLAFKEYKDTYSELTKRLAFRDKKRSIIRDNIYEERISSPLRWATFAEAYRQYENHRTPNSEYENTEYAGYRKKNG